MTDQHPAQCSHPRRRGIGSGYGISPDYQHIAMSREPAHPRPRGATNRTRGQAVWQLKTWTVPSYLHEALLLLFRNRPALAPELLRDALHVELPDYTEARIDSADLTDIQPAEYRADLVILLLHGSPVLGIVLEMQLSNDEDKRYVRSEERRVGKEC